AGQRAAHAFFEAAFFAAGAIELHQRRHVFIRQRTAIGAGSDTGQDLFGAGLFFGNALRVAGAEQLVAGRRAADRAGGVGAADLDRRNREDTVLHGAGNEGFQTVHGVGEGTTHEGDTHLARPGRGKAA